VDTAIKVIFSDEIIERLIDLVMEAQQQENTRLPVLKDQLRDTEKRLANLLEAIEQGILTPTTKQRLDELEARKEALNTSILEEELKKPVLTREWMRFWFEKFRKGDMRDMEHQRQIIDTFVNSVYVFDDRVVLNFNFTDDSKTISREEVLGSSAVDNAPLVEKNHRLRSVVLFVLLALCGMVWYTRLSSTTRNLSGQSPSILLRKTVLSLKSPTGAFIVLLRSTNANLYIKENIDETVFMFALFKCRKSDKGRN